MTVWLVDWVLVIPSHCLQVSAIASSVRRLYTNLQLMTGEDTELGSEVKLTPPNGVQPFHLQHLPHPHSGFSNSSMVTSDAVGMGYCKCSVPHRVELI